MSSSFTFKARLQGFHLKIIALLLMSIDHIGLFLAAQAKETSFLDPFYTSGYVLRCLGRSAFPLFIFLLAEGIRHTRSFARYLSRLFGMMLFIMLMQIILTYGLKLPLADGESPFVDLVLIALVLGLLKRKDRMTSLLVLPLCYLLFTTGVQIHEVSAQEHVTWFPKFLRPGYSLLGLLLGLIFFYAPVIARWIKGSTFSLARKEAGDAESTYEDDDRLLSNGVAASGLFLSNVLIWAFSLIPGLDLYDASIETWSILGGIIFLFYDGRRGHDSRVFRTITYLYFPLHLSIIWLIFYIIFK